MAYVPPHLRSRPSTSSPTSASSPSSLQPSRTYQSAPARPLSSSLAPPRAGSSPRTPWSAGSSSAGPSISATGPSGGTGASSELYTHPGRSHFSPARRGYAGSSPSTPSQDGISGLHGSSSGGGRGSASTSAGSSASAPARSGGRTYTSSSSAQLHVFGDSFVGPMKLLQGDCAQVKTFKGASAKGLNNPHSIKKVSQELLPILTSLLAPPPYAYQPAAGRCALLIFGNVDLQINYIWQLANKPISALSFASDPSEQAPDGATPASADEGEPDAQGSRKDAIFATATETSSKGPALGPTLFVEAVIRAYTTWLEREIVNGPIGQRLVSLAEARAADPSKAGTDPKVFIAAALPPLIEDEMLPRIPEKYVERLEEDFEKQQRAMALGGGSGGGERWRRDKEVTSSRGGAAGLEEGLSTLTVSDDPVGGAGVPSPSSPRSASSTSMSSRTSTSALDSSVHTALTTPSSPPSPSPTKPPTASNSTPAPAPPTKTPIIDLLSHFPPLCTLPVRVRMTNHYNSLLSAFCAQYPSIFTFVDIGPAMHAGSEAPSVHGEVDRAVWACPVDRTNVHPLWEPTLPLWMEEMKKGGVKTEAWRISEDAEETLKAYEVDKRRRTAASGFGDRSGAGGERIKLRDE